MAADGKPNLELLSKGLPAGWRAMWDKNSGDIYYGNVKTRVRIGGKGREQPPCLHICGHGTVQNAHFCFYDRIRRPQFSLVPAQKCIMAH